MGEARVVPKQIDWVGDAGYPDDVRRPVTEDLVRKADTVWGSGVSGDWTLIHLLQSDRSFWLPGNAVAERLDIVEGQGEIAG